MRVTGREDGARAEGARAARTKGRFADALRRAAHAPGRAATEARAAPEPAARAGAVRRARADAKDGALSERREAFRDDERGAAPRAPGATPAPPAAATAPPLPAAELRALVRALPVAVEAAHLRAGAPLALSFGRSLDVELRSTPAGVEVLLRPAAPHLRACEAELPRVVRALEARGVSVARAQVRARGSGAAPPAR